MNLGPESRRDNIAGRIAFLTAELDEQNDAASKALAEYQDLVAAGENAAAAGAAHRAARAAVSVIQDEIESLQNLLAAAEQEIADTSNLAAFHEARAAALELRDGLIAKSEAAMAAISASIGDALQRAMSAREQVRTFKSAIDKLEEAERRAAAFASVTGEVHHRDSTDYLEDWWRALPHNGYRWIANAALNLGTDESLNALADAVRHQLVHEREQAQRYVDPAELASWLLTRPPMAHSGLVAVPEPTTFRAPAALRARLKRGQAADEGTEQ